MSTQGTRGGGHSRVPPGGGVALGTRESGARAALAHPPAPLSPFRSCARGAGGAVEVRVGQSRRGPGWHGFAAAGAQPGARKRGVSCSRNPAGCNVTPTAAGGGWGGGEAGGGRREVVLGEWDTREGEAGRNGDGREGVRDAEGPGVLLSAPLGAWRVGSKGGDRRDAEFARKRGVEERELIWTAERNLREAEIDTGRLTDKWSVKGDREKWRERPIQGEGV